MYCRIWNNTDWDLNIDNQDLMTQTLVPLLSQLTPWTQSAYMNEGDFQEPEWQQVIYGANYNRLLKIKREYDLEGLFWGRTAVGSEEQVIKNDWRLCQID